MKSNFIKKSNLGLTISEIIFAIIIIALFYGAYLYFPLLYKSQELEGLAKDYTFKVGEATQEGIRQAVIEDARKKYDVELLADDVTVMKDGGRVKIEIIWRPVIEFPFGLQYQKVFTAEYDRKQLW